MYLIWSVTIPSEVGSPVNGRQSADGKGRVAGRWGAGR